MNIAEIESSLKDLVETPFDADTFIFRFLEIYDVPKATVIKLRQGTTNHAKESGEILWKNKLNFCIAEKGQAASTVDAMADDPLSKKHAPRFLLATDGKEVYCRDIKADQTRDTSFDKLNDIFDFFLPLAGIERYEGVAENPADIKMTARLAKLYDAILEANPEWVGNDHTHELNLFMMRMLFCFFAEDTSIFAKDLFTSTLMDLTLEDGADNSSVLETIFMAMNTHDVFALGEHRLSYRALMSRMTQGILNPDQRCFCAAQIHAGFEIAVGHFTNVYAQMDRMKNAM